MKKSYKGRMWPSCYFRHADKGDSGIVRGKKSTVCHSGSNTVISRIQGIQKCVVIELQNPGPPKLLKT